MRPIGGTLFEGTIGEPNAPYDEGILVEARGFRGNGFGILSLSAYLFPADA